MDFTKFTIKSQEVLQKANNLTESKGQQIIEPGHLLQAIFEVDLDVTPYLFGKLNVNIDNLKNALIRIVDGYPKVSGGQIYFSNNTQKILENAINESKNFKDEFVSLEMLL